MRSPGVLQLLGAASPKITLLPAGRVVQNPSVGQLEEKAAVISQPCNARGRSSQR